MNLRTRTVQNPLILAVQSMGAAGEGVMSRAQRDAIFDQLVAPLMKHQSQRRVLLWICAVMTNRAGERHSGNKAVVGPRRCGKSTIIRALAAMMVALDGFVIRVPTQNLRAPTANFLETAKDGGLVRLLQDMGLGRMITIDRAAGSVVALRLPWHSGLFVHDVGNERAIKKHHGITADLWWGDEAQNIDLLHLVVSNLVAPTLADSRGAILFSGTPGDQVGSLFHQISTGRDSAYSVTRLATWHNPLFGLTPLQRWHHILQTTVALAKSQYSVTAADFERMYALTEDELDAIATGEETGDLAEWVKILDGELLRQVFGRWVTDGAVHVFAWHRVSAEQLYYCAVPGHHDTSLPTAATLAECVALLPPYDHDGIALAGRWHAAISIDLGDWPDPCALLVVAWSPDWPVAYEVYSEKWWRLLDSEMLTKLTDGVTMARDAKLRVGTAIADATGMRSGTRREWDRELSQRYRGCGVGVRAPYKPAGYKKGRTKAINVDIEQGRFRCKAGGELDKEGSQLRYKITDAGKSDVDKHRKVHHADGTVTVPGNDLLDDLLYCAEDVGHMLCDLNPSTPAPPLPSEPEIRRSAFLDSQWEQ